MILRRLYELAERENMLDDPAFECLPVPYIVKVGLHGEYLGIEERRGVLTFPTKKGQPKTKPDKGKELLIAKPHGSPANAGFARYFSDTLARVLPIDEEAKSVASRLTFWKQMQQAAEETNDAALKAVCEFDQKCLTDNGVAKRIVNDLATLKPNPGDRCTFSWHQDEGMTILDRAAVRTWWREFYARYDQGRQDEGPQGMCQVTGEYGPIALVHTTKISGIPGGLASGVSMVSNDKAAFESYGLAGAANAGVSFRAADGYTRALQALIHQRLHRSKLSIGNTLFLFWTREKCELDDLLACLDGTAPDLVAKWLESPSAGRQTAVGDTNAFYCLTLSGNSARLIVRDYLESYLTDVRSHLSAWFRDLRIVDAWGKEIVTVFPLWQLALATALDSDAVSPVLPSQLMDAALKQVVMPESVLAACLKRLQAEGNKGFNAIRIGLIKLILRRKGIDMGEELIEASESPAYLCGRLMAVFERIQWGALGDVNANIVDRFYGTASTSPGLVFPRLFKSAQQHLGKLQGSKTGMAVNLQKDLESICSSIPAFPSILSLTQQGEFALGFYHQRATFRKGKAQD